MTGRLLAVLLALTMGCRSTRGTVITMAAGGAVIATGLVVNERSDEHTEACCARSVFIAAGGVALGSTIVLVGLVNLIVLKLVE
jgi:hypothetical protein